MDGVSKMDVFTKTEIIMMIMVVSLIIIGFIVSTIFDVINYQEKVEKKKKKTLVNEDLDYLKDDVNEILLEEEEEVYKQDDVLIEEEEDNHALVMENSEPKEESYFVENTDNTNSNIIYKDEVITKEEAKAELDNVKLQLEQEEIEDRFGDTVTNFELEQENDAIISLDELKKISDTLYESNEPVQYDDSNVPISINEIMSQYNEVKNDTPAVDVNVDSVKEAIVTNSEEVINDREDFLEDLEEAYKEN